MEDKPHSVHYVRHRLRGIVLQVFDEYNIEVKLNINIIRQLLLCDLDIQLILCKIKSEFGVELEEKEFKTIKTLDLLASHIHKKWLAQDNFYKKVNLNQITKKQLKDYGISNKCCQLIKDTKWTVRANKGGRLVLIKYVNLQIFLIELIIKEITKSSLFILRVNFKVNRNPNKGYMPIASLEKSALGSIIIYANKIKEVNL